MPSSTTPPTAAPRPRTAPRPERGRTPAATTRRGAAGALSFFAVVDDNRCVNEPSTSPKPKQATPAAQKPGHRKGGKKGKRRAALGLEEPHRACVVCRASAPSRTMLRFARGRDGGIGFDVGAVLPGRGAWVCATQACLTKALDPKHGGFARAFDAAVVVDAGLVAAVVAAVEADVLARLQLLRRQGQLVLGRDEVFRRAGTLRAVALAADLSANSRAEVAEALWSTSTPASSTETPASTTGTTSTSTLPPPVTLPPMERLGDALGTRAVGVVGLPMLPASDSLLTALARWHGLTSTSRT